MPTFYPSLNPDLAEWLLSQPLFFVASAPLTGAHVNVSPKGYPSHSLAVINPNQVAYMDSTGSGCETISHVYENGRVTLMACSFGTSPRILRLFCTGKVFEKGGPRFEEWFKKTGIKDRLKGCRSIIVLDVFKVQTSCGYGVPVLNHSVTSGERKQYGEDSDPESSAATAFFEERDTLRQWGKKMEKKEDALLKYQIQNNIRSLDGCTGLRAARKANGEWMLFEDTKARGRRVVRQWEAMIVGMLLILIPLLVLRSTGLLVLQPNWYP